MILNWFKNVNDYVCRLYSNLIECNLNIEMCSKYYDIS